jgi:hypothetical protein
VFSLDLDAKALTKSYRCQPTSSLTACANWIYDVERSHPKSRYCINSASRVAQTTGVYFVLVILI